MNDFIWVVTKSKKWSTNMNIVAIRFKQVRECMIDISQNLIKIAWEHCKCELWACAKFLFFCNTNANGCKQKARGCNMKNNIGWLWLQTRPVGDSVPWGHLTNQSLGLIFVTHIQWRQHLWPSNNTGAIVLYLQATKITVWNDSTSSLWRGWKHAFRSNMKNKCSLIVGQKVQWPQMMSPHNLQTIAPNHSQPLRFKIWSQKSPWRLVETQ